MGNDRIAVLSVKQAKSEQIFIVGVYLPTVSESTARYRECVDVLESILYQLHPSGMIILYWVILMHTLVTLVDQGVLLKQMLEAV